MTADFMKFLVGDIANNFIMLNCFSKIIVEIFLYLGVRFRCSESQGFYLILEDKE